MTNWLTALLPVIGVVVGAALQFLFSRTTERDKHLGVLRAQAYADYLGAVAASAHLTSDEDLVNALRSAADAKTRVLIYGSSESIAALARFEETGANLSTRHSIDAFVALVRAMRSKEIGVSERDLRHILVGRSREQS